MKPINAIKGNDKPSKPKEIFKFQIELSEPIFTNSWYPNTFLLYLNQKRRIDPYKTIDNNKPNFFKIWIINTLFTFNTFSLIYSIVSYQ